jgi:hypothetical protein
VSEIQTGIDAVENMAYEIGQQMGAIEADYKDIQLRVEQAREIAQYMYNHPDHLTETDVEQKAGEILEALNGI